MKILKQEFIGTQIKVVRSNNKSLVGLEGKIIDETKNTFRIQTRNGVKMLLKSQISFQTEIERKKVVIDGNKICFRSEERIKKIR